MGVTYVRWNRIYVLIKTLIDPQHQVCVTLANQEKKEKLRYGIAFFPSDKFGRRKIVIFIRVEK